MAEVRKTNDYDKWFGGLRDERAKARINSRIRRLELGNPGVAEPVGEGVSELKIDYGPGYRVYFMKLGNDAFLILCGGDKRTQANDIRYAKSLAGEAK